MTRAASSVPKPRFFSTPAKWRAWLAKHHESSAEMIVGFYKNATGKPSITWPESVDQALCFGWIDGVRRRVDDDSYSIRFTPRRKGSVWSAVNLGRVKELTAQGLMTSVGLAAFEARTANKSSVYAYENRPATLPPEYVKSMRANRAAFNFFEALPPGYRRTMTWWIVSAKREATR
ncbi:MAG: YdeI/OmpD-associated family protein, partial [Gemmatimonas sp.]